MAGSVSDCIGMVERSVYRILLSQEKKKRKKPEYEFYVSESSVSLCMFYSWVLALEVRFLGWKVCCESVKHYWR